VRLVEEHAALDVWDNPNSFMARQELVETAQQHLDLTGEGWVLLSHVGAVEWPVELWPIYPHRMSPVPDARAFLAGYVYAGPDGEEVPLKLNEVGLMRAPHPLDVMRGLSAVNALNVDLGTARAARTWNRNFFLNSAEPGGIIEVPRRLSDEEFEEMSARWAEQHRGVSAAHRVAIIEGENTHWIDRKYSMTDMQFVELLGMSDAAVRKAYRYPLSMMGESGDVNRATANAHRAQYAQNLLVPRLNRWKGMLNRRFLPQFGPTAVGRRFAYVSPVPADHEAANAALTTTTTAAATLITAGFTGDSVKEAYSLPEALV
jgi:HK97 family phage portal protein